MKRKNKIITCPGSINPDFVIRSEKPLRLFNRSMTFHGIFSVYAGGKGRNQAVAARPAAARTWVTFLAGGPPPTGKRYCINSVALKFVRDESED